MDKLDPEFLPAWAIELIAALTEGCVIAGSLYLIVMVGAAVLAP